MVLQIIILACRKLRQEDQCEFEDSLSYTDTGRQPIQKLVLHSGRLQQSFPCLRFFAYEFWSWLFSGCSVWQGASVCSADVPMQGPFFGSQLPAD